MRRQPLRDAQELLVLFSPQGRFDCVSRISVKRTGLLEPLTCIVAHLRLGRSLPVLQEVGLERTFPEILSDFDRLELAGYLLNLWVEAFPSQSDSVDPYRLLRLSLDSLEAGLEPVWLVTWTELQVMRLLGGAPQTRRCLRCGAQSPGWFSVEAGGALCGGCRSSGCVQVDGSVLEWLAFLQRASLLKLAAAQPAAAAVMAGRKLMASWVRQVFPRLARFGGVHANPGH
ncbi:DNA repair protein RecO [bacterium]|nr:DNA repair protein RecO [bacterium]